MQMASPIGKEIEASSHSKHCGVSHGGRCLRDASAEAIEEHQIAKLVGQEFGNIQITIILKSNNFHSSFRSNIEGQEQLELRYLRYSNTGPLPKEFFIIFRNFCVLITSYA